MVEHPHSIVLIKDTFNDNSNRYLMYYDSRWECKLFLNYATYVDDYDKNDKNIREHLRMELKVPGGDIDGAFMFEEVHEKYSVSAKKQKCYRHRFYKYRIESFADDLQKNDFEIEGKHFYWMSIAEMEKDPKIMAVNSDIVAMVKAHE